MCDCLQRMREYVVKVTNVYLKGVWLVALWWREKAECIYV